MNYEKVFESIKSNFVPKAIYEESKNEIIRLKIELQNARKDANKTKLELEKSKNIIENIKLAYKSNYDKQKMAIDTVNVEKERLKSKNERIEAENECLKSEMKIFEEKLNEFQSILTQKTLQYAYLLKQSEWSNWSVDFSSQKTRRMSTRSQTIKETPAGASASLPLEPKLTVKIGTKRKHTVSNNNDQPSTTPKFDSAKRRKCNQTEQPENASGQNPNNEKPVFTCEKFLEKWTGIIQRDFGGDINQIPGIQPKHSSTKRTL